MSLKETYKQLRDLLTQLTSDLDKGEAGNKAAAQRVRTGTVKLEKVAKLYRKESIQSEKKNKGQKKPAKSTSAAASSSSSKAGNKASTSNTTARKSTAGAKTAGKAKSASIKTKAKAKSTSFRPRALAIKRATAKLPTRRIAAS